MLAIFRRFSCAFAVTMARRRGLHGILRATFRSPLLGQILSLRAKCPTDALTQHAAGPPDIGKEQETSLLSSD